MMRWWFDYVTPAILGQLALFSAVTSLPPIIDIIIQELTTRVETLFKPFFACSDTLQY